MPYNPYRPSNWNRIYLAGIIFGWVAIVVVDQFPVLREHYIGLLVVLPLMLTWMITGRAVFLRRQREYRQKADAREFVPAEFPLRTFEWFMMHGTTNRALRYEVRITAVHLAGQDINLRHVSPPIFKYRWHRNAARHAEVLTKEVVAMADPNLAIPIFTVVDRHKVHMYRVAS